MGGLDLEIFAPVELCASWWHDFWYGADRHLIHKSDVVETAEYLCKRCGKRTTCFTTIGPLSFTLPQEET